MDELLVAQGLRKGYPQGDRWLSVLDDVSISVAGGEIVAVVGPRGEGKTTLLKVVAGLEPVDAGEVRLHGRPLTGISDGKRAALLRQEISWLDRRGPGLALTVRDYVALPLVTRPAVRSGAAGRGKSLVRSLRGRHAGGRGEARRRALYELDRVGAGGCATRRWGELSAWEQTRVMLARASLCSPRMLVVDDLLAGADTQGIHEAGDLLRALVQKQGFGVLMSASDLERALIADRVWRFDGGRLRLVSDQTGAGEADVIDFPGEGSQRRRLRGTGA